MSNGNFETIKLNSLALTETSKVLGVYFWTMRLGNNTFKIYAGKTNSLPRRLRDYKNEFQEHAPNDYKLRFFHTLMFEYHSDAELDLYFVAANGHTQKENEVVRYYRPLINEKAKVSEADRKIIKDAFKEYYNSIFKKKLARAIEPIEIIPFLESNTYELPLKQKKEIAMTNHDMIAAAMMEYRGKILETCEIKRIVLKTYPNFTEGSLCLMIMRSALNILPTC